MITITNIRNAQKDAFDEIWAIIANDPAASKKLTELVQKDKEHPPDLFKQVHPHASKRRDG